MIDSSGPIEQYDVVVVGYGPVGMVAAALLGRAGYTVGVFERYLGLYNLPRAATFDHETMRTLQALGCAEDVLASTLVWSRYQWVNGSGDLLIEQHFRPDSVSGWAEAYLMYQPALEDALDRVVKTTSGVTVLQGWRAMAITQDADGVSVAVQQAGGGELRRARGRYLLACDGGNSFVRQALGIGLVDLGFRERWLVCDFANKRQLDRLPMALQLCDPVQPGVVIQLGPSHRRWSYMILPEETEEEAVRPENVWRRVSRWVTPDDVELIRSATYVFQSLLAQCWRDRRVLLVGDAAHQMPPFLGQGMVSGIRDARNLAWKLDLVLRGLAGPSLLDSYQAEREPHVTAITHKAIELGRIQTMRDPEAARQRDAQLLARRGAGGTPERLEFPSLSRGVLGRGLPGAGELFPQGRVRTQVGEGLFDDVVGRGFVLLSADGSIDAAIAPDQHAFWQAIGGLSVFLGRDVQDLDGIYDRWLQEHGCVAAIVRPDCYAFGGVRSSDELRVGLDLLRTQVG